MQVKRGKHEQIVSQGCKALLSPEASVSMSSAKAQMTASTCLQPKALSSGNLQKLKKITADKRWTLIAPRCENATVQNDVLTCMFLLSVLRSHRGSPVCTLVLWAFRATFCMPRWGGRRRVSSKSNGALGQKKNVAEPWNCTFFTAIIAGHKESPLFFYDHVVIFINITRKMTLTLPLKMRVFPSTNMVIALFGPHIPWISQCQSPEHTCVWGICAWGTLDSLFTTGV